MASGGLQTTDEWLDHAAQEVVERGSCAMPRLYNQGLLDALAHRVGKLKAERGAPGVVVAEQRTDKQLDELKEVLPKPYADYVPDFPLEGRSR